MRSFIADFQDLLNSFPNFFTMVSDLKPRVETMEVPDILLSRDETLLGLSTQPPAPDIPLQELFDTESLLRYLH